MASFFPPGCQIWHPPRYAEVLAQGPDALVQGDLKGSEWNFRASLDRARRQQEKSWEPRTATGLARVWQRKGKRRKAQALLALVYDWFTEGFDTKDLLDAKSLLTELGKSRDAEVPGDRRRAHRGGQAPDLRGVDTGGTAPGSTHEAPHVLFSRRI
jgi:hypothetical protein